MREWLYYVAFAREFKHPRDFCVLKMPGWDGSGKAFATLRDGIAKPPENVLTVLR
jgi:hypothetical protein